MGYLEEGGYFYNTAKGRYLRINSVSESVGVGQSFAGEYTEFGNPAGAFKGSYNDLLDLMIAITATELEFEGILKLKPTQTRGDFSGVVMARLRLYENGTAKEPKRFRYDYVGPSDRDRENARRIRIHDVQIKQLKKALKRLKKAVKRLQRRC